MSLYGRIFAAGYERWTRAAEEAGLRDHRRRILAPVSGDVLEIGPGPGLNLPFYPDAVRSLTLAEPEEPMVRRLRPRVPDHGRVVVAGAEELPFDDDSFDFVVSTFVLCTVDSPARALAEVARVLRPGGRLVFMEHVRARDPRLARWQDRLMPLWQRFGHGCHCNRPTPDLIGASELELGEVERGRMPHAVPLVRPLAIGTATRR